MTAIGGRAGFAGALLALSIGVAPALAGAIRGISLPNMTNGQYNALKDYYRGLESLKAGAFKDAAVRFDHILQSHPKDPNLLTLYGLALEGMGSLSAAERAFGKALSVDADSVLARREHGLVLVRLGRLEPAQKDLADLEEQTLDCGGACPEADLVRDAAKSLKAAITEAADTAAKGRPSEDGRRSPQAPSSQL